MFAHSGTVWWRSRVTLSGRRKSEQDQPSQEQRDESWEVPRAPRAPVEPTPGEHEGTHMPYQSC